MHAKIREGLTQITNGGNMAILCGGSVKAENAVELAARPELSMVHSVGGASLNATSFL